MQPEPQVSNVVVITKLAITLISTALAFLLVTSTACNRPIAATSTDVRLRECPEASSRCRVIRVLPPQTRVRILTVQPLWAQVALIETRQEAWVSRHYLTEISLPELHVGFKLRDQSDVERGHYGFTTIGISGRELLILGKFLGVLFCLAFYINFGLFVVECGLLRRNLAVGGGLIAALLVLGFMGSEFAMLALTCYGLAFGVFGAALGSFGLGTAVRIRAVPQIILGVFGCVDIAFAFVNPRLAELQLLLAVILAIAAVQAALEIWKLLPEALGSFALVFSPPVVLFSMVAGLVLVPALIANWTSWQVGIVAAGFTLGVATRGRGSSAG